MRIPHHIKYRQEDGFGLVYNHENYGFEDANLYVVTEEAIDLLERVETADSQPELKSGENDVFDVLRERGFVTDG